MNKFLRGVFLLVVAIFMVGFVPEGEAAPKKVAVMPFQYVSGSSERRVAEIMTDQVTVALANSGMYTVLERTQLAHAIKEINFQWSGVVDPNQAIEFGKMSGADYTIVGKVLMAGVFQNTSQNTYNNLSGLFSKGKYNKYLGGNRNPLKNFIPKYNGKVTLDIRFIDNTTGQLVFAKVVEGSRSGNDRASCLNEACHDAAANVLMEVQSINPFTGTVLDSVNGKVYIDKGFDSGIRQGEILIVFKEGRPILDTNGQIIAVDITEVGKIKVLEVNSNHSICKVVNGGDNIRRNAKVKRGK
jgi:curli biogenesis system outer membrane secretion channel CsgG